MEDSPGCSSSKSPSEGATAPHVSCDVTVAGEKVPLQNAAAPTPVGVKVEKDDFVDGHSHNFKVKTADSKKHKIFCDKRCTVLEAIMSDQESRKLIPCENDKVIIQLGKKPMNCIIPTHFPCTCVEDGQTLVIHTSKKKEENIQDQHGCEVLPKDRYSVFYIDTTGGNKSTSKPLFINNTRKKKYKYLCVYGEKGMTVEDALKRDGRFLDDLGSFSVTDNNSDETMACTVKVENVHHKELKINVPEGKVPSVPNKGKNHKTVKQEKETEKDLPHKGKDSPVESGESKDPQSNDETRADVAQQREVRAGKAAKEKGSSVNTQEIYELLCRQFKDLKEWMEQRFPGDSFQEALNVRKENFGKIQQSFSEVHRMKELFVLGESICLLDVKIGSVIVQGTGFVLFDNFVLTNAHLFQEFFKAQLDIQHWHKHAEITVRFNYEDPKCNTDNFKANVFSIGSNNLDYAILELSIETPNPDQPTETKKPKVPTGLLRMFGPPPVSGEACILGHPKGGVKKMDPTSIIEKENREQAVNQNLHDYRTYIFTLCSINQVIKTDPCADVIMTYNSFMYHGSSGSPVFDAHGRVFGLHTGGYFYGFPKAEDSVIEYAGQLLPVFKNFVSFLKESGKADLLERVQSEAEGNMYLECIIKSVQSRHVEQVEPEDPAEPMDVDI